MAKIDFPFIKNKYINFKVKSSRHFSSYRPIQNGDKTFLWYMAHQKHLK